MSESVVTLSAPIKAHDQEISQLTLRRPTGKDVREMGYPYKLDASQAVILQSGVIAAYVARLADIPPSSVDLLDPVDLNALGLEIVGFFLVSDPNRG